MPPTTTSTVVYRCFNAAGELLYIGCTISRHRLDQHRRSFFFAEIARIDIEHFPNRADALAAERAAIATESPRYNNSPHVGWRNGVAVLVDRAPVAS